jgi:hypothetical protein
MGGMKLFPGSGCGTYMMVAFQYQLLAGMNQS